MRPALTAPKPSARASALLMTVSMASCRRRVSSLLSMMPSRAFTDSMATAGLAMTSFAPLAKAERNFFTASGFSLMSLGEAMMTLPYSFTP